jgi:hypothetical protein
MRVSRPSRQRVAPFQEEDFPDAICNAHHPEKRRQARLEGRKVPIQPNSEAAA